MKLNDTDSNANNTLTPLALHYPARLGAISKTISNNDVSNLIVFHKADDDALMKNAPTDDSLPKLISLASLRLDATYSAWAQSSALPMARQFPDIINAQSGEWNTDSIESSTGSPGIFASKTLSLLTQLP